MGMHRKSRKRGTELQRWKKNPEKGMGKREGEEGRLTDRQKHTGEKGTETRTSLIPVQSSRSRAQTTMGSASQEDQEKRRWAEKLLLWPQRLKVCYELLIGCLPQAGRASCGGNLVPLILGSKIQSNGFSHPSPFFPIKLVTSSHAIKRNTYFLKQSASWETGENKISPGLSVLQGSQPLSVFPEASFLSRRAAARPLGQTVGATTPRGIGTPISLEQCSREKS